MSFLKFYNEALKPKPDWVFHREIEEDQDLQDLRLPPGDYALYEPSRPRYKSGLPKTYRFVLKFHVSEVEMLKPEIAQLPE